MIETIVYRLVFPSIILLYLCTTAFVFCKLKFYDITVAEIKSVQGGEGLNPRPPINYTTSHVIHKDLLVATAIASSQRIYRSIIYIDVTLLQSNPKYF